MIAKRRGAGGTRDQIRAVGSSTVYPFATAAAELFVQSNPGMKSPIIESTGTGGGMKLFCAGLGADTPDMTHASRQMKASEFADCQANGVTDIIEIQVGLDGIAFASAQGPSMRLPFLIWIRHKRAPGNGPGSTRLWRSASVTFLWGQ